MIPIDRHPPQRVLRQFAALWLPLFSAILAFWAWRRGQPTALVGGLAAVGAVSLLVGLLRPALARPVFVGWMAAAFPLGWLVSHLLLAIVYYGVVAPIGLAMRLAGRDPLQRRFDRAAKSYWTEHNPDADVDRYFRQF